MTKIKLGLLSKILIVVIGVIFAVGSLTATFVFWQTKEILISQRKDMIQKLVIEQTHESREIFNNAERFSQIIASQEKVKSYAEKPVAVKYKEMVQIIDNYQKENSQYLAIYILDKNGKALVSSDRSFVGQNYAFRDYFKSAIEGKPLSQVLLGVTSKQVGYYFSQPILSEKKEEIVGVLVAKLNPEFVESRLRESELSKVGKMMLVNSTGEIYFSQKSGRIFSNLSQIGYKAAAEAVKNYKGNLEIVRFYDQSDNEEELVFVSRVGGLPYFLVLETSNEEIEAVAAGVGFSIGTGVLLAAVFALLLISLVVIKLLQPLKQIRDFSAALGAGDFNQRISNLPKDEIGEIANILNKMAFDLGEIYQKLEEKVKERTSDLERAKMAMVNIVEDLGLEKQNLQKFQMAVDRASDHVVITNNEGIIVYANPAVEKITGFSREEIVGKKAGSKEFWGSLMSKEFYEHFWKTIKIDKKSFSGEINNKRKNGQPYIVMATVTPILNDLGEVVFFLGIERDITHEKEVDQVKTEFVSLASHQLRTPLSSINWYTEMLLAGDAGKINKEQRKFLEEVYTGSQRMVDLVNSLLNVSRLELGTFIIEPKQTDIVALIKDVIKEQTPQIEQRKQEVATKFCQNALDVNIDSKLFRMVVQNLLSNAVKYTPVGGKIEMALEVDNSSFIIKVSDTGIGVPAADKEKIFTKLFRAANARENDATGTGLGLYIVKLIIDHCNGKIWFESKVNEGTTFYVQTPISGMKEKAGDRQLVNSR